MSLTPLLNTPLYLQLHIACALVSIVLGAFVVLRRRRDRLHKVSGYLWSVAMATVALSSFWIHEFAIIGPFSPIHLLSLLTLWSLWAGIRHAVAGRIRAHRTVFRNLYWYGLLVAGALNFLPGRRMNQAVFGEAPDLGLWFVGAVGALVVGIKLWFYWSRKAAGRGKALTAWGGCSRHRKKGRGILPKRISWFSVSVEESETPPSCLRRIYSCLPNI